MENKMETTVMGYMGYILGSYGDSEKEDGNYYIVMGYIHKVSRTVCGIFGAYSAERLRARVPSCLKSFGLALT